MTPDKLLLAVQSRLPCEPAAGVTVVLQVQPSLLCGQFAPAVKVSWLTVIIGGGVQCKLALRVFVGPMKPKVASWQSLLGIKMLTGVL